MAMERLVAAIASESLFTMMFASMTHIIIFSYKLTTAVFACIGFDLFVSIDMVLEVQFADKCFRAMLAFEGFGSTICMDPGMDFQIPFR